VDRGAGVGILDGAAPPLPAITPATGAAL